MPKIIIKEEDITTAGVTTGANFAVVVPGFCGEAYNSAVFDANGVYECSNRSAFETNVKSVAPTSQSNYGNLMARELLNLGYTVLYKKIESEESGMTGTLNDLKNPNFWACLKDKSNYNFRYICTGGYNEIEAFTCIKNVATYVNGSTDSIPGRGDCIALFDQSVANFSATDYTGLITAINNLPQGKFTATIIPGFVTYSDNVTLPGSFHYLACAINSINNLKFKEWYAVAGYTRGVCARAIKSTEGKKLGEIAINTLEPRTGGNEASGTLALNKAVNVIANIHGVYYLWGNRTNEPLTENGLTASHFLNIRQLCCTLKQKLYIACRRFTFDPNSDLLWENFCNTIRPTLEDMKANQGITDYKIIKIKSTKKATLTAIIRIVPIEAVEDFDLTVSLVDDISGTTVAVTE